MKRIYLFATAMLAWGGLNAQYTDFPETEAINVDRGDFAVADIDGDGDMDVLFSGAVAGGYSTIWVNDGNANFTVGTGTNDVQLGRSGNIEYGDINGDGHLDVIFAGWSDGASRGIALGDGTGNFVLADKAQYPMIESHTYNVNGKDTVVAVSKTTSCGFADFNTDGLLDYYVFADNTNDLSGEDGAWVNNNYIYYQQQDGSFVENSTAIQGSAYRFFESGATLIDFNKDGAPDIWLNTNDNTKSCAERNEAQRLCLLLMNDGFGNLVPYNLNPGIVYYKSDGTASWGDVDGDGYLDLLLNGNGWLCTGEDDDQAWDLYKNVNGTGVEVAFEFDAINTGRQQSVNNGSYMVDWDGDGVMDLITCGWENDDNITKLRLWKGDANNRMNSFTPQTFGEDVPGFSEQGLRIADLDGDGKPDLLTNGWSSLGRRATGWVKNESASAATVPGAPLTPNASVQGSDVQLTWAAPEGFNGAAGLTYNLSLYNKTTGKWMYNPMANEDGKRIVAGRMGNVFTNTEYWLFGLPAGEYEWKVQAINGQYMGGAFTAAATFTIGASGVESVSGYNPGVFVNDNTLSIVGMQGEAQTVNVYSISGALLNTAAFNDNIDLQLPQAGIYMVEVRAADGGQYITKVVVK